MVQRTSTRLVLLKISAGTHLKPKHTRKVQKEHFAVVLLIGHNKPMCKFAAYVPSTKQQQQMMLYNNIRNQSALLLLLKARHLAHHTLTESQTSHSPSPESKTLYSPPSDGRQTSHSPSPESETLCSPPSDGRQTSPSPSPES